MATGDNIAKDKNSAKPFIWTAKAPLFLFRTTLSSSDIKLVVSGTSFSQLTCFCSERLSLESR